jgi:phosphocarrier protein HPr
LTHSTVPSSEEEQMPSQTVTVGSRVGLHARPAALIAEAVGKSGAQVTLATPGGNPVDAGSPLMIMTLGAKQGVEVVVSSDDEAALQQIAGMVAQDLDAE